MTVSRRANTTQVVVGSGPRTFRIDAAGSPEVTVVPDLVRGPRVLVDGRRVERRRDGLRVYWPVTLADGSERRLFLAGHMTGLRAIVDGVEYPIERHLVAWELVLAVVPIGVLSLLLGSIGAILGGLVTGLAFGIFRAPWPAPLRVAVWAGALIAAGVVAYVAARFVA
ncbi:MAG TPA: hypothetical protein VFI28_00960 [Candidatus Limnocylindrales bacterium]|nr:hypothetical protein [Candidatus Limnocylindrales bacterium]